MQVRWSVVAAFVTVVVLVVVVLVAVVALVVAVAMSDVFSRHTVMRSNLALLP